jgi:hypothetical protein
VKHANRIEHFGEAIIALFMQPYSRASGSFCSSVCQHSPTWNLCGDRRPFFGGLLRGISVTSTTPTICEYNHSREFSALDHIPVFLRSHYPSMRKICPPAEGDQAAVRCWVTHCQQQQDSERDTDAHYHWHRRLSREEHRQRDYPRRKQQSRHHQTIFSARSRTMLPP